MFSYTLITPDGTKLLLETPKWNVSVHLPDGFDLPPLAHDTQSIYKQPGLQLKSIKPGPRTVALSLDINACNRDELHELRKTLWRSVRWNTTSNDNPPDPLILRYKNNGVSTDLFGYLSSQNVASLGDEDMKQTVVLQYIAYDPFWYRVQATTPAWDNTDTLKTTTLAVSQTLAVNYIAGKVNGIWDDLNGGSNGGIYALATAPNGDVIAGGHFSSIGGVAANGIARWDGTTWNALGSGVTGGSLYVFSIAIAPSGDVIVGGSFSTAGGVPAANIAKWDGANWSALGAGTNDWVQAVAVDGNGDVYASGRFTTPQNYIAKWNGAAWSGLGTGMNSHVYALALRSVPVAIGGSAVLYQTYVYATGAFSTADGNAAAGIAMWNGTTWVAMGSGLNGIGNALAFTPNGTLYVGGAFTTAGGISASKIVSWNGNTWEILGGGVDSTVYALSVDNAGLLYAAGAFASAGGLTLGDHVASWNGSSWAQLDINLPGSPNVYAITAPDAQSVFLGFDTTGNATSSGSSTNIINAGDYDTYPVFTITGPGTLQWIENVQSHKRIALNLYISAGEIVTIDLSPGVKALTSNTRGNLIPSSALLPQSDFASFDIPPEPIAPSGVSTINVLMTGTTGASSVTMKYREPFLSADSAVTP